MKKIYILLILILLISISCNNQSNSQKATSINQLNSFNSFPEVIKVNESKPVSNIFPLYVNFAIIDTFLITF